MDWLLVLGLKECLVECKTVCAKSVLKAPSAPPLTNPSDLGIDAIAVDSGVHKVFLTLLL